MKPVMLLLAPVRLLIARAPEASKTPAAELEVIEDCFCNRNAMFLRQRSAEARDCYLLKCKGDVEREVLFRGPLGHDPLP